MAILLNHYIRFDVVFVVIFFLVLLVQSYRYFDHRRFCLSPPQLHQSLYCLSHCNSLLVPRNLSPHSFQPYFWTILSVWALRYEWELVMSFDLVSFRWMYVRILLKFYLKWVFGESNGIKRYRTWRKSQLSYENVSSVRRRSHIGEIVWYSNITYVRLSEELKYSPPNKIQQMTSK